MALSDEEQVKKLVSARLTAVAKDVSWPMDRLVRTVTIDRDSYQAVTGRRPRGWVGAAGAGTTRTSRQNLSVESCPLQVVRHERDLTRGELDTLKADQWAEDGQADEMIELRDLAERARWTQIDDIVHKVVDDNGRVVGAVRQGLNRSTLEEGLSDISLHPWRTLRPLRTLISLGPLSSDTQDAIRDLAGVTHVAWALGPALEVKVEELPVRLGAILFAGHQPAATRYLAHDLLPSVHPKASSDESLTVRIEERRGLRAADDTVVVLFGDN